MTVDGDDDWANLAKVIGRPDLAEKPEYATAASRVAHRDELDAILQEWIAPLTPREAQERLQAGGVAAGAAVTCEGLCSPSRTWRRATSWASCPNPATRSRWRS